MLVGVALVQEFWTHVVPMGGKYRAQMPAIAPEIIRRANMLFSLVSQAIFGWKSISR